MIAKENIDKLEKYIGNTLSYKDITGILDIKYSKNGGNIKIKQLNEIQTYYKLEKVNRKYKIIEKYDTPIPYVDNRQSVYYDDLEIIMLYALQNSDYYSKIWSVTEALIVTTLVNGNYRTGKADIELTAEALEVDSNYLNLFYQSTYSRFKGIFESTLKRMRNKKLLDYKEVTMLYKRIPKIKLNDLGNPLISEDGKMQYTIDKVYTQATDQEIQYILKVERKVLLDMGYDNLSTLISSGKYHKYRQQVDHILSKKLNIEYYYKAYNIIHNKEDIAEAITEIRKVSAEDSLNILKLDALNNSKDKVLNRDLDNKEICIDILINKYPMANLKMIISNYLKSIKEEQDKSEGYLPF